MHVCGFCFSKKADSAEKKNKNCAKANQKKKKKERFVLKK
jgi:hypothetical protein